MGILSAQVLLYKICKILLTKIIDVHKDNNIVWLNAKFK
jgi:hypothetical protein